MSVAVLTVLKFDAMHSQQSDCPKLEDFEIQHFFSRLKRLRRLSILLSSFFFLSFLLGLFTKIYNYEFPWV